MASNCGGTQKSVHPQFSPRLIQGLSEPFYEHVLRGPVPVDMRALRAIKRSPLALDMYTWLTHRNFVMRNGGRAATKIAWSALQVQFGADYPLDSRGRADFKKAFHLAYRRVKAVYPASQLRDEWATLSCSCQAYRTCVHAALSTRVSAFRSVLWKPHRASADRGSSADQDDHRQKPAKSGPSRAPESSAAG